MSSSFARCVILALVACSAISHVVSFESQVWGSLLSKRFQESVFAVDDSTYVNALVGAMTSMEYEVESHRFQFQRFESPSFSDIKLTNFDAANRRLSISATLDTSKHLKIAFQLKATAELEISDMKMTVTFDVFYGESVEDFRVALTSFECPTFTLKATEDSWMANLTASIGKTRMDNNCKLALTAFEPTPAIGMNPELLSRLPKDSTIIDELVALAQCNPLAKEYDFVSYFATSPQYCGVLHGEQAQAIREEMNQKCVGDDGYVRGMCLKNPMVAPSARDINSMEEQTRASHADAVTSSSSLM